MQRRRLISAVLEAKGERIALTRAQLRARRRSVKAPKCRLVLAFWQNLQADRFRTQLGAAKDVFGTANAAAA